MHILGYLPLARAIGSSRAAKCRIWELSWGPLQEQCMPLTTGPSVQPFLPLRFLDESMNLLLMPCLVFLKAAYLPQSIPVLVLSPETGSHSGALAGLELTVAFPVLELLILGLHLPGAVIPCATTSRCFVVGFGDGCILFLRYIFLSLDSHS